jgi:type II secretory pathway component GspD/PulD (secretin)
MDFSHVLGKLVAILDAGANMVVRRIHLLVGLVACLCAANWTLAAELVLEVIELRYRSVEQVLPVVQPLVPKPGSASGMHTSLIVRTTAANLVEIRRVLAAIDREPRRLIITVRQDADMNRADEGAEISGSVSSGTARLIVPNGRDEHGASGQVSRGDDRMQARVYSSQALQNDRTTQQIQVLEGSEAFIHVGRSVPAPRGSSVRNVVGGRVFESRIDTIEYRDILKGFYVRPRLSGRHVTLDVSAQRDTPGNQGRGGMNVQRLTTTVSGRLGEWMEIGGIVSGRAFEESGTAYRTTTAAGDNRRVLLKVDEIR